MLDYVTRFIDRHGHGPSYQQIARHLGVSSRAGVQRHINALESLGLISRRRDNGSFGIELTSRRVDSDSLCNIEMAESIGSAEGGEQTNWTVISLPKFMLGYLMPGDVVAYKVTNGSAAEGEVAEGDVVLFEKRNYARRGETVLAETAKGRLILGRYYPQGTSIELRLNSDDDGAMRIASDEVALIGVLRGLLRPIPGTSN